MKTFKNGAILALFLSTCTQTNAIQITVLGGHKSESHGIFGKMIELSTAGETEAKEIREATIRKK